MIHPSTIGLMVVPVNAHTLSLRPFIVPAGVKLEIRVAKDNRHPPFVSFDGQDSQILEAKQQVTVMLPEEIHNNKPGYISPCICLRDPVDDWFNSLAKCLNWNQDNRTIK